MREIEFRGKEIDTENWIYGYLLKNANDDYMIGYKEKLDEKYNNTNQDIFHILEHQINPKTIGQYTELKDKNGKKIFEGDIIKFIYENKEKIRAIVFEKGEFLAKDDTTAFGPTFRHIRLCSNIEVIGNIYDNPELLKEEP